MQNNHQETELENDQTLSEHSDVVLDQTVRVDPYHNGSREISPYDQGDEHEVKPYGQKFEKPNSQMFKNKRGR